ncbi:MAG: Gfo/Idh/MocA family oxidoreductase [Bacteroidota bacterium]
MTLKTAIIGLGRMGAEPTSRLAGLLPIGWDPISHAESIKSINDLELTALCDVDLKKTERFSAMYNVPKIYTDYKVLINEVKPDIISIATRTNVKSEIINYAIDNGVKGVYVEKPLGRSITECEQILNKINNANAKIAYGAQRRAMPIYQEVKNICNSGEYGIVKHIIIEFGKSRLFWTHPHSTDLIVFFSNSTDVDYISAICAFDDNYSKDSLIIDEDPLVECAFIKFKNGVSANITQNEGSNIRIQLTNAIITINGDGYSIDINTEGENKGCFHKLERRYPKSNKSGTQIMFADLAAAVLNSANVESVSPEEILCGSRILSGIVESALKNGEKVNFKDIRNDLIITGRLGNLYA